MTRPVMLVWAGVFTNSFFNQYACDSLVIQTVVLNSADTTYSD